MFERILVALDRSDIADRALERVVGLAKAFDSRVMLVHVLSGDDSNVPHPVTLAPGLDYYYSSPELLETYRERWEQYAEEGLEHLRWLAEKARAAGVTEVEWTQPTGNPGKEICDLAGTWNADLIVVGRRGRRGLSELLLGSVSNYIVHNAPCGVMIVGPTTATSAANDAHVSSAESTSEKAEPKPIHS